MNNKKTNFFKEEKQKLKEKYGFKNKGIPIEGSPRLYQLFDYMCDFAERYREAFPITRKPKELKCTYCDFETEKVNEKGLGRHMEVKHFNPKTNNKYEK